MIDKNYEIPDFIKKFLSEEHPEVKGYTNAFKIIGDCPRLYATETLYGEWGASILLLAKDAAPTHIIEGLFKREGQCAWRHAEKERGDAGGYKTNERLKYLVDKYLHGNKLLYGSALANVLYDEPKWSRRLPGFRNGALHEYLIKVLEWVIEKMENVKIIACLGEDAWYLVCRASGDEEAAKRFVSYRDEGKIFTGYIRGKEITVSAHYHPAARVKVHGENPRIEKNWKNLSNLVSDILHEK